MSNPVTHEVKLIADVAVIADGKVLLVRYADTNAYDHQSGWFLPDDLIQRLEHPEDAARRILRAQLGVDGADVQLADIESFTGGDRSWHLAFHYRVVLASNVEMATSGDVESAEWFPLDALPRRSDVAHGGWALQTIEKIVPPGLSLSSR